jgi:hypothetical protein
VKSPQESNCLHKKWGKEMGDILYGSGDLCSYLFWWKCISCKATLVSFSFSDHTTNVLSWNEEWAARTRFDPRTRQFIAEDDKFKATQDISEADFSIFDTDEQNGNE